MTEQSNPNAHRLRAAQNALVEIPPQPNRKHLTEPSWIESMIYFTGVYLEREARLKKEETEESGEESPPKTEAA